MPSLLNTLFLSCINCQDRMKVLKFKLNTYFPPHGFLGLSRNFAFYHCCCHIEAKLGLAREVLPIPYSCATFSRMV